MNLDVKYKEILASALTSYIHDHDEYSVRYGIIGSSEFEDIKYGLWPEVAEEYINLLLSDNLSIDDKYVNDILSVVLTYKDILNENLIYAPLSAEDTARMKSDRKLLNSLIRFLKGYAADNNIPLPCLDDDDEEDDIL